MLRLSTTLSCGLLLTTWTRCATGSWRAFSVIFFRIHAVQGSLADVIQQLRRSGQVVDERFVFHVASQLLSAM